MKKIMKRLLTTILSLTTIFTFLPVSQVQAAETQYWTESTERVGIVEKVRARPPTVLTSILLSKMGIRHVLTQALE